MLTVQKRFRNKTKVFLVVATILMLQQPASAQPGDPLSGTIPDIRVLADDTRRALYLELSIAGSGDVSVLDRGVTSVPPAPTDEAPAMLLFRLYDAAGNLIGEQNAWNPRYEYQRDEDGIETVVLLDTASGLFQFDFDHRLATVALIDQMTDPPRDLAMFNLQADIQNFCTQNPEDINCEGFSPDPDRDNDGVTDELDNCPDNPNTEQTDTDDDGLGDVCDPTPNGELVPGDLTQDGRVDDADYQAIRDALGQCEGDAAYLPEADYTGDSCVAYDDYQFWYQNYFVEDLPPPGC